MPYRIGVDIGGTFTDLYAYDTKSKEIKCVSKPSTPENYALGVLDVIESTGIEMGDIEFIVHGTTVATNSIIERKFAKVAFITTGGFRDLIEIGRYHRKTLYDPYEEKPKPIAKRRNRYTVIEKIDRDGNTIIPLDEKSIRTIADEISAKDIDTISIGFMNSHANPAHEQSAKKIIEDMIPGIYISTSSEILPTIGALGRFTTSIINAALYPTINDYITSLQKQLAKKNFQGRLLMVQSNGGAKMADLIRKNPETLLLSGPAGGVIGANYLSRSAENKNIITFDMGGTSCDISVVEAGEPMMTVESEIDWDMPIPLPVIEIQTIGAGGGSIAWIDEGGTIKVGPKSAGAKPGPVCYDLGGTEPTVTDANLVLGFLDTENFLGGKMNVNYDLAKKAIEKLGMELGLNRVKTAEGILEIVNENMANTASDMRLIIIPATRSLL